jgi:hypothetical protein
MMCTPTSKKVMSTSTNVEGETEEKEEEREVLYPVINERGGFCTCWSTLGK